MFKIKPSKKEHTCEFYPDEKANAPVAFVAQRAAVLLGSNSTLAQRDLGTDYSDRYGSKLPAWTRSRGLDEAHQRVFGDVLQAYQKVQQYLNEFERANEGSIIVGPL